MARPLVLRAVLWAAVLGLAASLAVHLLTFTAYAPPPAALALHLGVFVTVVPVLIAAKAWAEELAQNVGTIAGRLGVAKALVDLIPTWQKVAFVLLALYVSVNFTVSLARLADAPGAGSEFRLFSGHWMLFYALSAILAQRLSAPLPPPGPERATS